MPSTATRCKQAAIEAACWPPFPIMVALTVGLFPFAVPLAPVVRAARGERALHPGDIAMVHRDLCSQVIDAAMRHFRPAMGRPADHLSGSPEADDGMRLSAGAAAFVAVADRVDRRRERRFAAAMRDPARREAHLDRLERRLAKALEGVIDGPEAAWHDDVVGQLLAAGASPTQPGPSGESRLAHARRLGLRGIASILQEAACATLHRILDGAAHDPACADKLLRAWLHGGGVPLDVDGSGDCPLQRARALGLQQGAALLLDKKKPSAIVRPAAQLSPPPAGHLAAAEHAIKHLWAIYLTGASELRQIAPGNLCR